MKSGKNRFRLGFIPLIVILVTPGCLSSSFSNQQRRSEEFKPKKMDHSWTKDFLFPDQLPRVKKQLSIHVPAVVKLDQPSVNLFIPSGCGDNADYCEDASDYPDTQYIKQIVKNRTSSLEAAVLFNSLKPQRNEILVPNRAAVPLGTFDSADQEGQGQSRLRPGVVDHIFTDESSVQLPKESTDLIQNSQGKANFEYIEEVPVCDSAPSYVYPRTARNINQEWRFVVNLPGEDDENYTQAVKVEKCVKPGESCNLFEGMGSRTVCRQKYSYKKMLALSDTGQQYIDSFRFPSCCVCYAKKVFGYGYAGLELLRTEEKTAILFQEPNGDFNNTVRDIEAQVESTTGGDDQDELDYQEITTQETDISGSRKRRGGKNSKRRN